LVKEVFKSEMPVGNCSVLNMESSLMDKCHQIKQLEEEMMLSILSSLKPELENMYQEPSS